VLEEIKVTPQLQRYSAAAAFAGGVGCIGPNLESWWLGTGCSSHLACAFCARASKKDFLPFTSFSQKHQPQEAREEHASK